MAEQADFIGICVPEDAHVGVVLEGPDRVSFLAMLEGPARGVRADELALLKETLVRELAGGEPSR